MTIAMPDHGDDDLDDCDDGYEQLWCMTCLGEGYVESLSQETGRYLWDTDGPGKCPNCGGTWKRKDQTYW